MNESHWILDSEPSIRLGFFAGTLAVVALWELLSPQRRLTQHKGLRWANNLGLVVFNSFLIRVLFPTAAVGAAVYANAQGWGLFHWLDVPWGLAVVASIVLLDMGIYWQHVIFHHVPLLWRLHQVHHADLDYDLTTGLRFHSLEILLSMLIKFALVILLGAPAVAVVIFEVMLSTTALFNHGNIRLPKTVDRHLRKLLVTPDMHRVHHSIHRDETNSNFGFALSCWDRWFGTYIEQPRDGQLGMTIGLSYYRDPRQTNRLPGMLGLPFKRRQKTE